MFIDPPRRIIAPGQTNQNKDYFILTFLWALATTTIIAFVCVLTIPYYFHYKMWVFILSCILYPIVIALMLSTFFLLCCLNKQRPKSDANLLTDSTCQICFHPLHNYEFHSKRLNRFVYLLFSIYCLVMNLFQIAVTLELFIRYCKEKQLYEQYLAVNPTNKDEVFFTVVNFLIMVVSFALAVYEIYRMVTVVIKIIKSKLLKTEKDISKGITINANTPIPTSTQSPSQLNQNAQIFQHNKLSSDIYDTKHNQVLQSASTQRPLSFLNYFVHPLKYNDIPYSLRVNADQLSQTKNSLPLLELSNTKASTLSNFNQNDPLIFPFILSNIHQIIDHYLHSFFFKKWNTS